MDEVHTALKTAPLALAPGAAEAASEHVQLLLPQVKLLEEQLREVGNCIKRLLSTMIETNAEKELPPCDAGLILSIPGVGPAVAAALLTEASRPIRERDYEALRCYAGTAPVTGKAARERPSACVRLAVHACEMRCSTGRQAAFAAIAEAEGTTTRCGQQATSTHGHYAVSRPAAWRTNRFVEDAENIRPYPPRRSFACAPLPFRN
ncbi:MAG: transposase [Janthinobacterium lividum]